MKIRLNDVCKFSIKLSMAIFGALATIFTIIGVSLKDLLKSEVSIWIRIGIVVATFVVLCMIVYFVIRIILGLKKSISFKIGKNDVTVCCGNIWEESGIKVISFDSTFICDPEKIDDKIIKKSSLHGQLVLKEECNEAIKQGVLEEANRLGIEANEVGTYEFNLGTIIPVDKYRLLAFAKLQKQYEAHTDSVEYMCTLMNMWKNLYSNYNMEDIIVPLLGSGITRFDSGSDEPMDLVECMLRSLEYCDIHFKSRIKIVIYNKKQLKLVELFKFTKFSWLLHMVD